MILNLAVKRGSLLNVTEYEDVIKILKILKPYRVPRSLLGSRKLNGSQKKLNLI